MMAVQWLQHMLTSAGFWQPLSQHLPWELTKSWLQEQAACQKWAGAAASKGRDRCLHAWWAAGDPRGWCWGQNHSIAATATWVMWQQTRSADLRGSVKHTQRADTASSRGLPQETWKNSSSTPTKTSGRATTRARWAQSCWEGAAVLLDARLNWLTLHIFTESKLDSGQKRKEKSLSPMLNSSGIPVLSANLAKKIINTTSL